MEPSERYDVAAEGVCWGPTWKKDDDGEWLLPQHSIGMDVIEWCEDNLLQPDGDSAGDPLRFTDEQLRWLMWWFAVDDTGRFLYNEGVLQRMKGWGKDPLAAAVIAAELCGPTRFSHFDEDTGEARGRQNPSPWIQTAGAAKEQTQNTFLLLPTLFSPEVQDFYAMEIGKEKAYAVGRGPIHAVTSSFRTGEGGRVTFFLGNEALALDTPIPTPTGWTSVEDVQEGDMILGSNGPTKVTHITDVYRDRPCFEVTFQDGSSLVADAGHLWSVKYAPALAKEQVKTTLEIFESLASNGGKYRYTVPAMSAPDFPAIPEPVDPYVLGLWLGDGEDKYACLTVGDQDLDFVLAEVLRRGVPAARVLPSSTRPRRSAVKVSLQGNKQGALYTKDGSSFRAGLVKLGVLGNKHVPPDFLRASLSQRLELLRGLMDSDGCATKEGKAIFVNSNRKLADGVLELARSLGLRASMSVAEDRRWSELKIQYRVQFTPRVELNPFLLPRKVSRVKTATKGMHLRKSIRSVTPVASVPVKCIEVDADDHLFVAGAGWTLTHNTQHWVASNGGHDMDKVIKRNLAKGRDGAARYLKITNAPLPGEDSVAERDWYAFTQSVEGRLKNYRVLYDSLEAPPDTKLEDPDSLRRGITVARGDSDWLNVDRIMDAVYDINTPPQVSRRFYLNQIVAAEDAWADPQQWDSLADVDQIIVDGEEIVAFFDGSRSDDSTGIIGVRVSDGFIFKIDAWEHPSNPDKERWEVPRNAVNARVDWMFDRFKVLAFYCDMKDWESYIDAWAEKHGSKVELWAQTGEGKTAHPFAWDMRQKVPQFTKAAERTQADIEVGSLSHDGDPALRRHVHNARRAPNRWGVSLAKEHRESAKKIDLAVCAVGARQAWRDVKAVRAAKDAKKPVREGGKAYSFS